MGDDAHGPGDAPEDAGTADDRSDEDEAFRRLVEQLQEGENVSIDEDALAAAREESGGESAGDDPLLADEDEEFEAGPAMNFGLKVGLLAVPPAIYVLFLGPMAVLAPSPIPDEFLMPTGTLPRALLFLAGALVPVSLLAGLLYPMQDRELYEEYRQDLVIGVSLPAGCVLALPFLIQVLQLPIGKLVVGNLVEALVVSVAIVVAVALLIATSIGFYALLLAYGILLYLPAAVGVYPGSFIGRMSSPTVE